MFENSPSQMIAGVPIMASAFQKIAASANVDT